MDDPHAQAQHFIRQAQRAAKRGDHAEAERWTRTAERFALSVKRIDEKLPDPTEDENDALCEELRARLMRYAAADQEIQAWDREKEIHDALTAQALRHNLAPPPPLRACPYDENDLTHIAVGDWPEHLKAFAPSG